MMSSMGGTMDNDMNTYTAEKQYTIRKQVCYERGEGFDANGMTNKQQSTVILH